MNNTLRSGSHYSILGLALVAACLLYAIAGAQYARTSAQSSKTNGLIAFSTNRNGVSGEIYVMNPDGSNQQNISRSPASETRPAFSPDGKKIAFVKDFKGIYSMNSDGSGVTTILDGATAGITSISGFPSWSPDGTKIAFDGYAKGSPDGADIYVVNADGTGLTRLTTDPASDNAPAWSPDGKKIAFSSLRNPVPGEVNYEIYVMNADGANQTRITNNTKFDHSPSWSPDGARIAFTSARDGNFEVYVMNADGSNQTRLTNNPEQDSDAKWSPDGTKIVFMSSHNAHGQFGEIYTMNPDGTKQVDLTNMDSFDMDPSWQPIPGAFVPPPPIPTPTPSGPSEGWAPFQPAAEETSINVLSCGGQTFVKSKFTFPDAGNRIADWGQAGRSDGDFSVDVRAERWTGTSTQSLITAEQVYDLGRLSSGTYSFTLKSQGAPLKTEQFTIGAPAAANPVEDASVFVRQHYIDFLGRNPDDQGFGFWTRNMTSGCGADADCLERKRIDTSAAFFLSIEFQRTGFLVYRLYRASYGRMPRREEFLPDARTVANGVVVNATNWESTLTNNEHAFVDAWVNRLAFKFDYDQLSNDQFVDRLIANTGASLARETRDALVGDLVAGRQTRAAVLRTLVEDGSFGKREFNSAFVLMQYFGYLQRNPDEGQDTDMRGFNFWLNKLNQFGGDYFRAEMVKAFLDSDEFRGRFCSQ